MSDDIPTVETTSENQSCNTQTGFLDLEDSTSLRSEHAGSTICSVVEVD